VYAYRKTIHTPSIKLLEIKFKLPKTALKNTFKTTNTIAIQFAGSIILHKKKYKPTNHFQQNNLLNFSTPRQPAKP